MYSACDCACVVFRMVDVTTVLADEQRAVRQMTVMSTQVPIFLVEDDDKPSLIPRQVQRCVHSLPSQSSST